MRYEGFNLRVSKKLIGLPFLAGKPYASRKHFLRVLEWSVDRPHIFDFENLSIFFVGALVEGIAWMKPLTLVVGFVLGEAYHIDHLKLDLLALTPFHIHKRLTDRMDVVMRGRARKLQRA